MSTPTLRPSQTFKGTDLGDEYLFYDREGEQVHLLNSTAREIYLLCDGSRSQEDVAGTFAERYVNERDVAWQDALQTIQELVARGLVVAGER